MCVNYMYDLNWIALCVGSNDILVDNEEDYLSRVIGYNPVSAIHPGIVNYNPVSAIQPLD